MKGSGKKDGSALLIVIIVSAAFFLYASSFFWAHRLMNESIQQQVAYASVEALADSVADYAYCLVVNGELEDDEEHEMHDWPISQASAYCAKIISHTKGDKKKITARLLKDDQVVKTITYLIDQTPTGFQRSEFRGKV